MYTRWLYTHMTNPIENIEIRHYKCGHYYVRKFLSIMQGKYIVDVFPFQRIKKDKLIELLEHYMLYECEATDKNENK